MNFGFDEQQDLLRSEVRKFLDAQCPIEEVRRIGATADARAPELWKQLAELGWLGLVLPEAHGGAGLGWVDLVVVLEETGRALLPAPLVSTLLAGHAIAAYGSDAQRRRWLPAIADGTTVGALALFDDPDVATESGIGLRGGADGDAFVLRGEKAHVADAPLADLYVVAFRTGDAPGAVSLALVERNAAGVDVEDREPLDPTRRHGALRLDGVRVERSALLGEVDAGWAIVERLFDCGAVATTAEMIGASEAMLDMTVQYAKDRVQFGSPIGRYQGVKHPLAEAYVQIECMKSLLYYAAWAIDEGASDFPLAASRAKGLASEAFRDIGAMGIQLHGAVGYTEAYDVHLYLRRSKWARPAFGSEDHHYERVARLGGL